MRLQTLDHDKTYIPDTSSGLARSHRLIRIEREKELIFMKLCARIKLDDFKKTRSENQREFRKLRRQNKHCSLTQ
jgi:hypothetical protein